MAVSCFALPHESSQQLAQLHIPSTGGLTELCIGSGHVVPNGPTITDWIQLAFSGALVLVTLVYVVLTRSLSASSEQANDTSLMILRASETSRLDARLPLYVFKLDSFGWRDPDLTALQNEYYMSWRIILLSDQPIRVEYASTIPNVDWQIDGTRNKPESTFARAEQAGPEHTIACNIRTTPSPDAGVIVVAAISIYDLGGTVWDTYTVSTELSTSAPAPTAIAKRDYAFLQGTARNAARRSTWFPWHRRSRAPLPAASP
jgi:hypothetical protein